MAQGISCHFARRSLDVYQRQAATTSALFITKSSLKIITNSFNYRFYNKSNVR